MEKGYFRGSDGTKLFYAIEGPSNAPVLCFCYGLVCSRLQWKYQMQFFRKNYRVLYMDYSAHNRSKKPKNLKNYTIEGFANDLACLQNELKINKMHLLGHSLGVNVVLEYYRQFREHIASLVLTCGTPRDPFETMFHHNFPQIVFRASHKLFQVTPELMRVFWKYQAKSKLNLEFISTVGFNKHYASPSDVSEYLQLASSVDLKYFFALAEDFAKYDCCYWLDTVSVPTLIVGGDRDLITPLKTQKLMHRLIPDSTLKIIKDGSHCVQMEQKHRVNKIIESFLLNQNL